MTGVLVRESCDQPHWPAGTIARCQTKSALLQTHCVSSVLLKKHVRRRATVKTTERPAHRVVEHEEESRDLTLGELYDDYRERLLRFVLFRVHGDDAIAEDIVQEAFTAALVSLSGFRSRSSPYTWLCSIAQHKIADHYRRESADQRTGEMSLDHLADNGADGSTISSIERWLEYQETRDMVRRALQDLPDTYANVIRYKYFEGLTVSEIGRELGRSPKAVEGLLARARRALSSTLTEAVHS